MRNRLFRPWFFVFVVLVSAQASRAASTGTAALLTPQGSGAGTANGDYVTATGGLNTFYRYFIEVPSGLSHFVVDLFDSDVGAGGGTEDTAGRDRDRDDGYATTATYTLLRPDGTTAATIGPCGSTATATCADNAWTTLLDSTGETYRDEFGAAAYNNNNGSLTWSTNWIETNDDANAGAGQILITGGELRIGDNGGAASTIEREANLTGFGTATFSFDFRTQGVEAGDQMRVEVSANGGASWTTLETFTGAFAASSRSYAITSSIAADTRVRFISTTGYNTTGTDDFFFVDNLQIIGSVISNGHWELRVDTGGSNDIDAVGIRAHDGTSGAGGTELNVYYDSQNQIGINPPASGSTSRTYSYFPYLTSGCSAAKNDFDYDSNSGTVGSMSFTSRGGGFVQNYASGALSTNDTWRRDTFSGWTTDALAADYGIWSASVNISNYTVGGAVNGNYANVYLSNFQAAANPPAANPTTNAFRVYIPNDSGAAPAKTYLSQQLTFSGCGVSSGPNPPVVGQSSCYTVTVQVVNPEAQAVTFSAANQVTANVPGTRVLYAGLAAVSQGTITAQPSVGGSGDITWNPGTVGAGVTATLAYRVRVTPTAAGQRNPMTATPASGNGTRAQYVDNTGNTTQTRATYLFGPLCELATTVGLLTPALVSDLRATANDSGVAVEWNTASEVGAVSFDVLRYDRAGRHYVKVNDRPLGALLDAQQGGHYRLLDPGAPTSGMARYVIVEHDNRGGTHRSGPFRVAIEPREGADEETEAAFARQPKALASFAVAPPAAGREALKVGPPPRAVAGSTLLVARVRETGVYRLFATDIAAIVGLPLQNIRKDIATHTLYLSNLGQEVFWLAAPGYDSILFYGQASSSPFAPENVYLLKRRNGMRPPSALELGTPPTDSATFRSTLHAEQQKLAATVVSTDPRADFWYWEYVFAGDPTAETRNFSVSVPGAVAGGADARLSVKLRGATSIGIADEHHAIVRVNGAEVGEVRFTGFDAATGELDVPSSLLHDGDNQITVEGVLDSGVSYSIFYVDAFDLTYDRALIAEPGGLLFSGNGNPSVTVTGFTSPEITVWDVSDPRYPAPVNASIDLRRVGSTLSLAASPDARYLAFTPSAVRTPDLGSLPSSTLLDPSRAADEVIIAPEAFVAGVQPLATWRRGQGLAVEVVALEDIWAAFNYGMPDPLAIRSFLDATRASWLKAPRYVLLAGNGTFDYRDYKGLGGNWVPPALVRTADGLFASDVSLADFDGDGDAEMQVGRLPVMTETELADTIEKIIGYESSAAGAWVGKALLLADADGQTDFAPDSGLVEDLLLDSYSVDRFELQTEPVQSAHGRLIGALNSGASVLNFVGHGGLDRFSSLGLLTSSDVPSLGNGNSAPVVTAFTCFVNRFEIPGARPLGSDLVTRRRGGAVAVLAPSALSMSELGRDYSRAFYRAFADGGDRLGDVNEAARLMLGGSEAAASTLPLYNLLGDPALQLRRPAPQGGGPGGPPSSE